MSKVSARRWRNSTQVVKARSPERRLVILPKPRKSWLLAGTALATGSVALAATSFVPGGEAWAANECGVIPGGANATVDCNIGPYNNGIEYEPSSGSEVFTLNVGNGSAPAVIVNAPPVGIAGQVGVGIANFQNIFGAQIPIGGVAATSILNINADATVTGSSIGALVWTKDDYNDATVNNYGVVYSTGAALSLGHGLVAVSEGGNATVNNTNKVESVGDAMAVWSGSDHGTATATNSGTLTSTDGNGIAIRGVIFGILPTFGAATATNNGTIYADEHGILVEASGPITIANNSMTTIDAGEDGIHAEGHGGAILITNGEGLPPQPDGLIIADDEGIWAENKNGGNITIYNGMTSNSASQIYANGDYGIYARSRGDDGDTPGTGVVEVWNFGYIETTGYHADAGVYVRTSGDLGGYAAFYNGAAAMAEVPFNINARVNAYELEDGGKYADLDDDANGVELVKMWGDGSGGAHIYGYGPGEGRVYGVFTRNYGTWDFTGADNYLTPGYDWGDPVAYGTEAKTTGGIFAPNGSAFLVRNFGDADSGIWNYGTAIGQGSRHDPVIDIETKYYYDSANTYDSPYDIGNRVFIYNAGYDYETGTFGLIGSKNTPYAWPISPQEAMEIGFGYFTGGGVDWDFIEGLIDDKALKSFSEAAGDRLINANWDSYKEGAPVWIYNEGLLIGQVRLNSHGDEYEHNLFENYGAWFTKGFNGFFGGPYDELWNYGLIQTAFEKYDQEWTGFIRLNEFHNYGVLSMIDGRSGDETKTTGDYFGGGDAYYGSEGLLAVDVRFGPSGPADDYPNGRSDVFKIGGDIYGSTGVIVHGTNKEPGGIQDPYDGAWGIDVVEYDGEVYYDVLDVVGCYGPCKAGDPFYISPLSKNYFESSNGVGLVEDGAFAWYMLHDYYYKEFELFSTWGPGSILSPGVTTGAQTIAHDLFDIVRDHNYGYQFANAGGGGADLPVETPADTSTSSGGSNAGLWAKVSGSWTERDTSITEDLGGGDVTFDTGSSQDIYSVLGGADMKPGGADSPIRIGLFGGYVTSQLDFDLASTSSEYEGGVLGGYAAYNNGAFYVDATVKGELLDTTYSFAGIDVGTDVTNIGVSANTGYKMMMGAGYIEPVASFTYVHTSVDDFTGGGASFDYSNADSIRAGAGARIGTAFGGGSGPTTELSLLGKVWNEFEDANEVTVTDGMGATTTFSDDISGLFGEVSATAMVTSADGTMSGFISAGGQFGEDFTSVNAKAGVRKGF